MNTSRTSSESDVLACLADDSSTAAIKLLVDLCRETPDLHQWLRGEFARDSEVRDRFDRLVAGADTSNDAVADISSLNGEDRAWKEERRQLRKSNGHMPRIYGGLTWAEMECAFRQYEAGGIDLGAFLLAHDWREASTTGSVAPTLVRASLAFLRSTGLADQRRMLKHYTRALHFLEKSASLRPRREVVGHTDWWKLQTLLYMLRNPRPTYRTRDVRGHLATLGIEIASLDFRRFCNRHGIRRDMRPGRPRT